MESNTANSKNNKNIKVLGIDLGTTYSCVGTIKNGRIEIIPNDSGDRTTPSVVSFKKKQILVGKAAKNLIIENSKNTIYDSKRLIGRRFKDKIVQEEIKNWDFNVEKDPKSEKPEYVITFNNKEDRYYPEEISSLILKKIYSFSKDFTNKNELKAVITVPAQFTNGQRESTKKAAEMAGLEVIRIINEPTAAAIGYLYNENLDNTLNHTKNEQFYIEEKIILVFDLGGGTFDTSIVKVKNKTFEVLATCGDNHLGGEDFTNILTDYLINCFKEDEGFEDVDFKDKNNEKTYKAFQKLKSKVEEYKKNLSFEKEVEILSNEAVYEGKEIKMTITKNIYENECEELFQKCFDSIDKVLKLAKLKKEDINEIALSGGSSRTPKIQEMIKDYFNKEPLKTINPDEAIAYGATIVACIESGIEIEDKELLELKDLKIIDITSCSIGIEVAGDKMEVIIPKGEQLPDNGETKLYKKVFRPEFSCGYGYFLRFFEGENESVKDNYKLGEFCVKLSKKENNNLNIIKVLLYLNSDSIITIIVKENDEKKIEVKSPEIYPKNIMTRFFNHIRNFEKIEIEMKKKEKLKNSYNKLLKQLNKIFNQFEFDNEVIKKDIKTQITEFTKWNRNNKDAKSLECEKKIQEIKDFIERIQIKKIITPNDNI